jgi:pimeloyl-ACP methyl ester carboxylesterase
MPQVVVKVLQNCSHWVQQDYPEQVNDIMREWFAQHPLSPQ